MHAANETIVTPRAQVPYEQLCPGAAALEALQSRIADAPGSGARASSLSWTPSPNFGYHPIRPRSCNRDGYESEIDLPWGSSARRKAA
jgi:hypothetical protein